jgi:hypothetical protein
MFDKNFNFIFLAKQGLLYALHPIASIIYLAQPHFETNDRFCMSPTQPSIAWI